MEPLRKRAAAMRELVLVTTDLGGRNHGRRAWLHQACRGRWTTGVRTANRWDLRSVHWLFGAHPGHYAHAGSYQRLSVSRDSKGGTITSGMPSGLAACSSARPRPPLRPQITPINSYCERRGNASDAMRRRQTNRVPRSVWQIIIQSRKSA